MKRLKAPPTIIIRNSQGDLTFKCASNGRLDLPNMDRYTAGIELSNACRSYYTRRVKAAESVKRKLGLCGSGGFEDKTPVEEIEENVSEDEGYRTTQRPATRRERKHTTIDAQMERLKKELVGGF